MLKRLRNMYRDSTLAFKIRVSNMIILVPLMILLVLSVLGMYTENMRYQSLLEAAGVASEFSLEFKEDFDYETYLVVVENKTLEESELEELLSEANRIVEELKGLTDSGDNMDRISSVDKYLDNLQSYIDSIALNLETGSRYEENMMIWENDVQIVTSLIQETFNEYIFNEIRHMQQQVGQLRRFNITFVGITGIGTLILLIITIISSAVIPRSITRPIDEISRVTRQGTDGDLDVRTHIEHGVQVCDLGEDV